jgi:hypothetical protein
MEIIRDIIFFRFDTRSSLTSRLFFSMTVLQLFDSFLRLDTSANYFQLVLSAAFQFCDVL